jgi:acyl-CoA synthetase (AMP-forming)/AMP-acid ligase II
LFFSAISADQVPILGGENIYPVEIEVRLCEHPSIARAAVVGIKDDRYGEVVGAFLQHNSDSADAKKPADDEIRDWTRAVLGRHKAPTHIFWFGSEGLAYTVPQTGSGKVKKHELRALGAQIVEKRMADARVPVKAKL